MSSIPVDWYVCGGTEADKQKKQFQGEPLQQFAPDISATGLGVKRRSWKT